MKTYSRPSHCEITNTALRERHAFRGAKSDNGNLKRRRGDLIAHCGFTLIELVAVVVVLGIITTIVMLSVSGHIQRSRLLQAADRLESLDRKARDEARRGDRPVKLVLDGRDSLARIQLERQFYKDDATMGATFTPLDIAVIFPSRRASRARQEINISPNGQSATYAVQLTAPNNASLWILTLGRTGQHHRLETEDEVRALLAVN